MGMISKQIQEKKASPDLEGILSSSYCVYFAQNRMVFWKGQFLRLFHLLRLSRTKQIPFASLGECGGNSLNCFIQLFCVNYIEMVKDNINHSLAVRLETEIGRFSRNGKAQLRPIQFKETRQINLFG